MGPSTPAKCIRSSSVAATMDFGGDLPNDLGLVDVGVDDEQRQLLDWVDSSPVGAQRQFQGSPATRQRLHNACDAVTVGMGSCAASALDS